MRIFLVLMALASPLSACPGGQSLFSCTVKNGTALVQVCQTSDAASYIFGPSGRPPDLVLASSVRSLGYRPWNGIGRAIYEEVTFENGAFAYTAWQSIDKVKAVEEAPDAITGGVIVTRGDQTLAALDCDPGTLEAGLDLLYELKQSAGQCYDVGRQAWQPC